MARGDVVRQRRFIAPALSLSVAVALVAGPLVLLIGSGDAAAQASVTLYAAPGSPSGSCSLSSPCTLAQALATASSETGVNVRIDLVQGNGTPCASPAQCTFAGADISSGSESSLTIEGTGTGASSSLDTVIDGNYSSGNQGTTLTDTASVPVILQNLEITGGYASSDGGGIYAAGVMTIINCTISGNVAYGSYGGGIYQAGGAMTIVDSTIDGNTGITTLTYVPILLGAAPADGGGIAQSSGTMTIVDSTIAQNVVTANTAAGILLFTYGGGIFQENGEIMLVDSTIADNSAPTSPYITSEGGGVFQANGTIWVAGSIVAGNSATAGYDNCGSANGRMYDIGYNLSSGSSCGFGTTGATGSLDNATLDLGALGEYGGPTDTIALLGTQVSDQAVGAIASPATVTFPGTITVVNLCSGTVSGAAGASVNLSVDQRGIPRPALDCDAGAYQHYSPPPPPPGPEVTSIEPAVGPSGGGTSVTIDGENFLGAAYVLFGTTQAASFVVDSATQITATSPSGTPGSSVDVTVITPGGSSPTTSADRFGYLGPPEVTPVGPLRICDTRSQAELGLRTSDVVAAASGSCANGGTPIGPGQSAALAVAGIGGVPPDASAVLLNVTAVDAGTPGYLTVYPAGTPRPGTSSLNVQPGTPVANMVLVGLAPGGEIAVYNGSAGPVDLVVDLEGYVSSSSSSSSPGGLYVPTSAARICDTRPLRETGGTGDVVLGVDGPCDDQGTAFAGTNTLGVQVAGLDGIPSGAVGVLVHLTVSEASSDGYLTAYPAGSTLPVASSLNYEKGATTANSVVVGLGQGGAIELSESGGDPEVTVDVEGYLVPPAGSAGPLLVALPSEARICDTRSEAELGLGAGDVVAGAAQSCANGGLSLGGGATLSVAVAGIAGVPADAAAVVVNLTATDTTAAGSLSAYPTSGATPASSLLAATSVLNWAEGQTTAGLVVVPVGQGGTITLENAAGSTNVVVDVMGYVAPQGS